MDIKKTVEDLEERLQSYISVISIRTLEYTPFIVEVGALTVGTDDKGLVIVENKRYPMQFSEKAVKEICSMAFRDCFDNVVQPKVYSKYEWYSEQIERIQMTINELKKAAS
jgi:HJR/Mrr/RecB family endonuclease